jgi:hypothetical protein
MFFALGRHGRRDGRQARHDRVTGFCCSFSGVLVRTLSFVYGRRFGLARGRGVHEAQDGVGRYLHCFNATTLFFLCLPIYGMGTSLTFFSPFYRCLSCDRLGSYTNLTLSIDF